MKEIGRLHTKHGDLVCCEVDSPDYPGYFVYLEKDQQSVLVSTTEIENSDEQKYSGSIVCCYAPEKNDPVEVIHQPMYAYDDYFKADV